MNILLIKRALDRFNAILKSLECECDEYNGYKCTLHSDLQLIKDAIREYENSDQSLQLMVKKTERGWAGHYICAHQYNFRRNTLLEKDEFAIVISTVGLMRNSNDGIEEIGHQRYYETMAFEAKLDGNYLDADVTKSISFDSDWAISEINDNSDNLANEMHEKVVEELTQKMSNNSLKLIRTKSVRTA